METITAADGGTFNACLAIPPAGRGAGLVLLHDANGLDDVARHAADWFAARGFVVVAPDLSGRPEGNVEDAAAAMDYLRHHADCNGQVGAVGFGAGGRLAFLLAARFDPEAAVAYDGAGIEAAVAEAGGICTPFLLHLALDGSTDPAPAVDSIRNGLKKKRMVTLHEYPGRRPGFVRPGDDNHDPAAAELANLRTVDFLVRHL